jgi:nitrite reductase (cytochrome c-552)
MTVVASFIPDFLNNDIHKADPVDVTCAQCHIEYHWDAGKRQLVTLPYNSLETMHPDKQLEYYTTGVKMPDGTPYFDYVNPRSGIRQIKIQHPEFETLYAPGAVHSGPNALGNRYNCADCHMSQDSNAAGRQYTSHFWVSPLNNPSIMERGNHNCTTCHTDLERHVRNIQGPRQDRLNKIGSTLAIFMEEIVVVNQRGNFDVAKMNQVRTLFRNAQFYWDYVQVENSNGAHNSRLTDHCLKKAEDIYAEARAVFRTM